MDTENAIKVEFSIKKEIYGEFLAISFIHLFKLILLVN